jgi:hypothetical protein
MKIVDPSGLSLQSQRDNSGDPEPEYASPKPHPSWRKSPHPMCRESRCIPTSFPFLIISITNNTARHAPESPRQINSHATFLKYICREHPTPFLQLASSLPLASLTKFIPIRLPPEHVICHIEVANIHRAIFWIGSGKNLGDIFEEELLSVWGDVDANRDDNA